MNVMLLAAGRGSRLQPLTDTTPKPLISVSGKTLLDYHLEKLNAAGFTKVVINTSWLAEKIQQHIEFSNYPQLEIKLSHEPTALETAGGVNKALPALGEGTFLLISADVWSQIDYAALRNIQLHHFDAHLLMVNNPAHNSKGDFSLVNNRIVQAKDNTLTYTGIGLFNTSLFNDVSANEGTIPVPLRAVLNKAIERNALTGSVVNDPWFDIGTVERLRCVEQFIALSD